MLERCVSLYDPERHGSAAFVYGQDSCVSALSFLSWVLLIVGESRAAAQAARRAVEHADATKHVHSQAVALCLAGLIARIMMRDVGGVAEHAPRALALTEQQGLVMWRFSAVIADGWLAAQRGLAEAGIARMREGLDGLKSIGVGIVRPFFLSLLAEAYGGVGRPEAGLEAVAEALARTEENGERIWSADLHRLRGDLLLARGGAAGRDEAQAALIEALAIARSQGARYWELRAATSLARLWRDTGEAARGSEELASVCAVFDADAGLPDVAAARALMRELGPAVATDAPTALAL
jgi:predicted ATPase